MCCCQRRGLSSPKRKPWYEWQSREVSWDSSAQEPNRSSQLVVATFSRCSLRHCSCVWNSDTVWTHPHYNHYLLQTCFAKTSVFRSITTFRRMYYLYVFPHSSQFCQTHTSLPLLSLPCFPPPSSTQSFPAFFPDLPIGTSIFLPIQGQCDSCWCG